MCWREEEVGGWDAEVGSQTHSDTYRNRSIKLAYKNPSVTYSSWGNMGEVQTTLLPRVSSRAPVGQFGIWGCDCLRKSSSTQLKSQSFMSQEQSSKHSVDWTNTWYFSKYLMLLQNAPGGLGSHLLQSSKVFLVHRVLFRSWVMVLHLIMSSEMFWCPL